MSKKITLCWELRIEREENQVRARVECLVLRLDKSNRIKVGDSENERIRKVQIDACMRMDNRHGSFGPNWDSKNYFNYVKK